MDARPDFLREEQACPASAAALSGWLHAIVCPLWQKAQKPLRWQHQQKHLQYTWFAATLNGDVALSCSSEALSPEQLDELLRAKQLPKDRLM